MVWRVFGLYLRRKCALKWLYFAKPLLASIVETIYWPIWPTRLGSCCTSRKAGCGASGMDAIWAQQCVLGFERAFERPLEFQEDVRHGAIRSYVCFDVLGRALRESCTVYF